MKKEHWYLEYRRLQQVYARAQNESLYPLGLGSRFAGQGGTSCDVEDLLSGSWGSIITNEDAKRLSDNSQQAANNLRIHRAECPPCIEHFSEIK